LQVIGHNVRQKTSIADSDPHYFWKLDPAPHWKERLNLDLHRSQNSGGVEAQKWSHGGPLTLTMETWSLKIEPWKVYRSVVADLRQQFDEERIHIQIQTRSALKMKVESGYVLK
jgi:hypothetical protein